MTEDTVSCPRPLWDALKQTLEVIQDMPNATTQGQKILTMLLFDMQCAEAPTTLEAANSPATPTPPKLQLVSSTGSPL